MKTLFSICIAALAATTCIANPTLLTTPTTQLRQIQDLNGSWVVLMDEIVDGLISNKASSCKLSLTHKGETFLGKYNDCMPGTSIDGVIYDEKLISAIQYTEKDGKNQNYCVYSGKIAPDGSIRGTYYTDKGESGDFQWINATNYIGDFANASVPAGDKTNAGPKPVYIAPSGSGTRPSGGAAVTKYGAPTNTPGQQSAVSTAPVPDPTPDTKYHFVEEDDSMYRLAVKYGLKLKQILWLNHRVDATDDKLQLGERIRVSE